MDELLRLLPPIRRTRGNRLYAADGRRFLDLWMDGGRGIMGEAERPARGYAANAVDKGLVHPYPGLYDARFAKALLRAWPRFGAVRLFANEAGALASARRMLGDASALPVDPAGRAMLPAERAAPGRAAFMLARPFVPAEAYEACALAMVRLPLAAALSPAALMAADEAAFGSEAGDLVPGMRCYAATRAMDSLARAPERGYGEPHWRLFDKRMAGYFERRGPYLLARCDEGTYRRFFEAALDGGALVAPRWDEPAAVPADFDDGELKRLAAALAEAGFGA